MLDAALKALEQVPSRPFRAVLLKSAGVALMVLIVIGVVLDRVLAAGIGVWEMVVRLNDIQPYVLPAPSAIGATLATQQPALAAAAWVTAGEVVVGFVLSGLVGAAVALAIANGAHPKMIQERMAMHR